MAVNKEDANGGHWIRASDGVELYVKVWQPEAFEKPVAVVLAFHGLGEHIGRYDHVFPLFAKAGIKVVGYDQRGCGRSGGARGDSGHYNDIMADARTVWDYAAVEGVPQFVFGHSLGGLHALSFAAFYAEDKRLAGVVASAPALQPAFEPPKIVVTVGQILRNIPFLNTFHATTDLDLTNLSRDPEVAKAYVADKYTFNKISLRSGAGCINQGNVMMRDGHVNFRHPVFIAFGDQDRLTSGCQSLPACQEWFEKIPSTDKELKIYEGFYHERTGLPVHNEPEKAEVIQTYIDWILKHAQAGSQ